MGKMKKAGKVGTARMYMTRTAALRKLQLSLVAFRKLCILKGVFPRVPKKKIAGRNKIYYSTKDIQFLAHDPLIDKFREYNALQKKIAKAKGRNELDIADKFKKTYKTYTLDHIIKERYPSFNDAIHDLDDCLTMVFLYASLPAGKQIHRDDVETCNRLVKEWNAYVTQTQTLKKVFVSFKGIYYQAEVEGVTVTWIVPHQFTPTLPENVDYRVMSNFMELYKILMQFILFKLYSNMGLHYPPQLDESKDTSGAGLDALLLQWDNVPHIKQLLKDDNTKSKQKQSQQSKVTEKRISTLNQQQLLNLDKQQNQDNKDTKMEDDIDPEANLFKGLRFYINREVPRAPLEFIIRSFGGEVSWDNHPNSFKENDPKITHQIVDRDVIVTKYPNRDYIQPQWIFDSVNEKFLLPVSEYLMGVKLPPHLSPFVNDESEGYVPERRETLNSYLHRKLQGLELTEDFLTQQRQTESEKKQNANQNDKSNKRKRYEEEPTEEEIAERRHAAELSAELRGENEAPQVEVPTKLTKEQKEYQDKALASIMMSKKNRKLMRVIQYSKAKKSKYVNRLQDRRNKIDAEKQTKE